MQDFIPGQRWISDAELQLGLGTVLAVDQRTVTVLFLAAGETRTYARQTAPLTRVEFAPGDSVKTSDGWILKIETVEERSGLLAYMGRAQDGTRAELEEAKLDSNVQLNRPVDRLFSGQIDKDKWFELRYQALQHANRISSSDLRGLMGGRTSLIPHQLYIAHEVANRYAPRVLLADEVGLGKTIEAGLILHQQLLTERAQRVLIVVPESLQHQWLVEMLRRFNLHFKIFDEERCQALETELRPDNGSDDNTAEDVSVNENPFHAEQLVLCSLGFVTGNPRRFKQIYTGNWDMLVIDEAHHLQWSPQQVSLEYELIEMLAAEIKAVLLLTATPEQLGKASHFARLRLLDPDRFPDFDRFIEEEASYEPVAQAIEALLDKHPLDEPAYQALLNTIEEEDNRALLKVLQQTDADEQSMTSARAELIEHLLDRHGTGRVLFRNTRAAVKGFPGRKLHSYPLSQPQAYAESLKAFQDKAVPETTGARLLLCPELLYQSTELRSQQHWTRIDPRIDWLNDQLKQLKGSKVLVVSASAETAMDIAEALRVKSGMHAAVFHEQLSLVERDRAAAYFADQEYGSQVLVCSEIGSEGRNFQFAHHIIMFDLPLNPDLLEQRIGRLDRIGQSQTIQIHVPYMENSAQAVMLNWFHDGLDAFEQTCPVGHNIFEQVEPMLMEILHQIDDGIEDLPLLIATSCKLRDELVAAMQRGRDRLLEYNSCRPHIADALKRRAAAVDTEPGVMDFLQDVFDCFDIDSEEHSDMSYIIRPGHHMQSSSFPGLLEEGMTITCDRDIALANEDMHFITWEHPLVTGAMDMVFGTEYGNTAVTAIKYRGTKPGSLLLECLYVLESASSDGLQAGRYLPPTTIRVVVDQRGNNHEAGLSAERINEVREFVDVKTARKILRAYGQQIRVMVAAAEKMANQQAPQIITVAHDQTRRTLLKEVDRLKALRAVNPNVRDEEIEFFETQWQLLTETLEAASLRLDALRVIVTT